MARITKIIAINFNLLRYFVWKDGFNDSPEIESRPFKFAAWAASYAFTFPRIWLILITLVGFFHYPFE